jgi:hypothetical protein
VTRVLIAGLARSGTTWLGEALSGAEGTAYLDEPDNHYRRPWAFRAKAALPGRAYPRLQPGDSAPDYEVLWRRAFGLEAGSARGRRAAAVVRRVAARRLLRGVLPRRLRRGRALVRRDYAGGRRPSRLATASGLALPEAPFDGAHDIVAKSVYAARSVPWVAALAPARVLVLRRDLRGVVASWKAAGWLGDPGEDFLDELGPGGGEALAEEVGVPLPRAGLTQFGRIAWLLACLASELRAGAARHPDWVVTSYEELVADAGRLLPELAGELEIAWSPAADARLRGPLAPPPQSPGIDPRLSDAEAEEIGSVLEDFSLRGWAW